MHVFSYLHNQTKAEQIVECNGQSTCSRAQITTVVPSRENEKFAPRVLVAWLNSVESTPHFVCPLVRLSVINVSYFFSLRRSPESILRSCVSVWNTFCFISMFVRNFVWKVWRTRRCSNEHIFIQTQGSAIASLVDHIGNYGIDLFGSDRALIGRQSFKTSGRQLSGLVSMDRGIKEGKKREPISNTPFFSK